MKTIILRAYANDKDKIGLMVMPIPLNLTAEGIASLAREYRDLMSRFYNITVTVVVSDPQDRKIVTL